MNRVLTAGARKGTTAAACDAGLACRQVRFLTPDFAESSTLCGCSEGLAMHDGFNAPLAMPQARSTIRECWCSGNAPIRSGATPVSRTHIAQSA